tara:strand:+ start:806 stop:1696 length:891 start_codon:yes stop_codon:yes gene_type:complete
MSLTIIIISYKSLEKLEKCLSTIGGNFKIVIVENSNNNKIKEIIENKYSFCKVIINDKNLGYAAAANIGLKDINTQFALLLNTDTFIKETEINEIEKEIANNGDDFALATPIYDDLIDFSMNNEFDKNLAKSELDYKETNNRKKVEVVKGCSLVINLNKFNSNQIFDSNYFFFYEEIDLCKRIKDLNENIFVFSKIKIYHGNASSLNSNDNDIYDNFRNWNYYWSRFYYFKKHYGFHKALIQHLSKLLRFFVTAIFTYLFSKKKFKTNKYRFLGLICSILRIKSSKSNKILETTTN